MPDGRRIVTQISRQDDFTGSLTDGYFLKYDSGSGKFTLAAVSSPTGANPSASVGLSAVNGSASTFLRSDGAPALDQGITPTWTGAHTFNGSTHTVKAGIGVDNIQFLSGSTTAGEWSGFVFGAAYSGTRCSVFRFYNGEGTAANGKLWLGVAGLDPEAGAGFWVIGNGRAGVGTSAPMACLDVVTPDAGVSSVIVRGTASQSAVLVQLRGTSSTTVARQQADIDTAWADSTDATRKARLILRAWDTAAREGIRVEADGSVARTAIGGGTVISGSLLSVTAQAATDVPFTLKGASSQSGNMLEILNSSDAKQVKVTPLTYSGNDVYRLTLGNFTGSVNNNRRLVVGDNVHAEYIHLAAGGKEWDFGVGLAGDNDGRFVLFQNTDGIAALMADTNGRVGVGGASFSMITPLGQLHVLTADATTKALVVQGITSQSGVMVQLTGKSSTTAGREQADIDTAWADSTDATRKARLVLRAWDTAAREGIRVEASGSEPMLGFFGVSAVARAVLATGAGHTVDDVISALQALGLVKQS